jgi:hypothetical protein
MANRETRPISYAPEAILTTEQVAEWLQCGVSTVEALGLPRLRIPGRVVRYAAGEVLAFLEGRYTPPAA